jgi:ankyrin repeat protein
LFQRINGEKIPLTTLNNEHAIIVTTLAISGNSEVMRILFENGVSARLGENLQAASPIMCAVLNNQSSALQVLLKHGADSNFVANSGGATLLLYAAYKGSLEAVKLLVEHFAYCDATTKDGYTALKSAVKTDQYDIDRFLLDHGANCNLTTAKNKTLPLHMAIQGAAEDKVSLALVKLLAFYTDNIDAADNRGDTALMIAVSYKLYEIIHILVSLGANINAPCGKHKLTPYACALNSGDDKCLEALLKNINSEADLLIDGKIPLWIAALAGNLNMLKLLLNHGANPSTSSSQELQTILQQAKEDCPESLERALIYFKNSTTNSVNISALDIAKIMGHTEVAALLESKITLEEEPNNKRKKLQ